MPRKRAVLEMANVLGSPCVTNRKVPSTARNIARYSIGAGSRLFFTAKYIAMKIGPRYCRTVAVAALDCFTAAKYVYCTASIPRILNTNSWPLSFLSLHIVPIFSFFKMENSKKSIPADSIRTEISHSTLIARCSNRNCPNVPETPHSVAAVIASTNPLKLVDVAI